MVGAVHTTGVIDKVGITTPAAQGELDTSALGHTQVATLAKHLAAQLVTVDPQVVVGLVADLGMALAAAFNVSADTTVPDQVHRCFEHRTDQFIGGQLVFRDIESLFHLRSDFDRLGATLENATALGNQAQVVVRPA